MPEIKHTFQGGKMNKDLDARLVPNGQYRDAVNIQVRTTDGDSAGTVQNLQGNALISSSTQTSSFSHQYLSDDTKVIASIADEKNDKAYFFIASPDWEDFTSGSSMANVIDEIANTGGVGEKIFIDSIIEVDASSSLALPTITPVVTDRYAVVNSGVGVLGTNTLPDSSFVTFNVEDASKYRVDMNVQAFNDAGTNLFTDNVKIKSINTTDNTITLYDQQEGVTETIELFIFSHEDRPLNFSNSTKITGINIIDDLLFWTDNKTEPKKINITRSKDGTNSDGKTHTQLKIFNYETNQFSLMSELGEDLTVVNSDAEEINDDLKEEHVTVMRKAPTTAPTLTMSKTNREGLTETTVDNFNFSITTETEEVNTVAVIGDEFTITSSNFESTQFITDDILTFTEVNEDNDNYLSRIVVKVSFESYLDADGEPSENNSPTDTIKVRVIALHENLLGIPYNWKVELELKKPLFEKVFGRFAYRYRYEDGEYSAFSPFSELAFLPGEYDYSVKKGYNLGMVNEVRELIVKDFIPINTDRPYDVRSIDILFKSTDSPNVHIVKTIKRKIDSQWEFFTPGVGNTNLVTGELHITSDMIHQTVPSDQILRSWDNVPRFALAQEITANRLVYGNYTQGYNINFELDLQPHLFSKPHTYPEARKSIKANRKYKIGIVLGDKYGRETPVIESSSISGNSQTNYFNSTGDIDIPKKYSWRQNSFEIKNNFSEDPPMYFDYLKYYVKETTNEYYNLIMDRWYYARDGNLWLSFASSDRNKVDLETYLILKNANAEQDPVEEKARYKIIDIQNEAPEFIRIDTRLFKPIFLDPTNVSIAAQLFEGGTGDVELNPPTALTRATSIDIPANDWKDLMGQYKGDGNLRIRIVGRTQTALGVTINELATNYVSLSHWQNSYSEGPATVHFNTAFGDEADMHTRFTDAGYSLGNLKYFLEIKEEVPENKPEFDGRFFVLVEKDITLEYQIIKTLPINMEWNDVGTHAISYIDSRRWNPAIIGPYAKDTVDATTYSPSLTSAQKQKLYEWGGGRLSSGAESSDITWPGDHFHPRCNWGNDGETLTGETVACPNPTTKPRIRDFAVGCGGADSGNQDWAAATAPETKNFWEDWVDHYRTNPDDRGGSKFDLVFIDAARSALWKWNVWEGAEDDLGISSTSDENLIAYYYDDIDGNGSDSLSPIYPHTWEWSNVANTTFDSTPPWDSNSDAEAHGAERDNPKLAAGRYYKPWGLDRNPHDVEGTGLNRLMFSIITDGNSNTLGWNGDRLSQHKHERFKGNMQIGSYFRFQGDPDQCIYRVRLVEESAPGTEYESGSYRIEATVNYMSHQNSGSYTGGAAYLTLLSPDNYANGGEGYDNTQYFGDNDNQGYYIGPYDEDDDGTIQSDEQEVLLGLNYDSDSKAPVLIPTWGTGWHAFAGGGYPNGGTDGGSGSRIAFDGCWPAFNASQSQGSDTNLRYSIRVTFDKCDKETGLPYGPGDPDGNFLKGIDTSRFDPRGQMRHDGTTTMNLIFVSPLTTGGQSESNDLAACWETEPKDNVDLDLYYEASNAIPLRLKKGNTLAFAPINSTVGGRNNQNGTIVNVNWKNLTITEAAGSAQSSVDTYDHFVRNVLYTSTSSLIEVASNTVAGGGIGTEILQKDSIGVGTNLTFLHKDGTRTESKVTDFYKNGDDDDIVPVTRYSGSFTYSTNQDEFQDIITIQSGIDNIRHGMMMVGDDVPPGIYIKKYYNPDSDYAQGNYVYKLSHNRWIYQEDINGDNATNTSTIYNVEFMQGTGLYEIDSNVHEYPIKLGWFNCYSFGNGVESDRIRDDFNAPQIDNGVKVSTTFSGYREEYKSSGLIHSGLYNSTSEVNNLNEFNMSNKITKDLNPSYGSIQRMKTRDTDVVVLTEDKVLKVLANKDALFNADGNPQLISTDRVLGQTIPFVGDYGISKNPESLAWDQYRMYFTDKQRGAVLRLSRDGLTPISDVGMRTWFRDNLRNSEGLLGTFDTVNDEYNLTINYKDGISTEDQTISFNEASKGWVSFKSFVPEHGVSVSDKYLTAIENNVYQHYIPEYNSDGTCPFTVCQYRNRFYGSDSESSISILFNEAPGTVKSFKTMNYEGSQAKIDQFIQSYESNEAGNNLGTLYDGEYYNIDVDKRGWYVDTFETDLQSGKVVDFKNKENKWFNRIRGIETSLQNLDTSEFTVQGIGTPTSIITSESVDDNDDTITIIPQQPSSYDNIYGTASTFAGPPGNYVQENSFIEINVSTTNVAPGTTFNWTTALTPLVQNSQWTLATAGDFSASESNPTICGENFATGTGTIGQNGIGTFYVGVCQDGVTEGAETFLVSIISSSDGTSTDLGNGQYLSMQVFITDTSWTSDDDSDNISQPGTPNNPDNSTGYTLTVEDEGDEDIYE